MSKKQCKKWVKSKVRTAGFKYLLNERGSNTENIVYSKLKMQNYLKSSKFSNFEVEILSKLR